LAQSDLKKEAEAEVSVVDRPGEVVDHRFGS